MFGSDSISPAFDGRSFDLHCPPAGAAHQMVVVMSGAALAVQDLTVGAAQGVDLGGVDHRLQVAVDRGQADRVALRAQSVVDVLGAREAVEVVEDRRDGASLAGVALDLHHQVSRRMSRWGSACGRRRRRKAPTPAITPNTVIARITMVGPGWVSIS